MTFGKRLYELRKKVNITQSRLANELFVSRQAVSRWECDLSLPDILMLKRLADYFKVSMRYLINGADDY